MAVFHDRGVGPCYNDLMAVLRHHRELVHYTVLRAGDVRDGALRNFQVFMVPGGRGRQEARTLDPAGEAEIKRFVREGGCYVGTCAGLYLATEAPGYLGLLPVGIADGKHWFRGKATLPIEFTRAGAEVFGVDKPMAKIVYHNGPILNCKPIIEHPEMKANFVPLSFFRAEIVGRGGEPGVMKGAPAMVLARYGKGLVLGMSPHPEQTPPLHRIIPHALAWLVANVNTPGTVDTVLEHGAQERIAPPAREVGN